MRTVVLDTSVVVAGMLSGTGASAAILQAFMAGKLRIAYTPGILDEYVEVLGRPKFSRVVQATDIVIWALKIRKAGVVVTPVPVPEADWPDEDDLPFVAAALACPESLLVTLNPRDFSPAEKHGLRVLAPGDLMKEGIGA